MYTRPDQCLAVTARTRAAALLRAVVDNRGEEKRFVGLLSKEDAASCPRAIYALLRLEFACFLVKRGNQLGLHVRPNQFEGDILPAATGRIERFVLR